MTQLLWLIPALPLAGFLLLVLAGSRMPVRAVAGVGVGSVGAAAALAWVAAAAFVTGAPAGGAVTRTLGTWLRVETFVVPITLRLDGLSLALVLVVATVGFLIHVYSTEHLRGEDGYRRFFAVMNLFVAAMLILVLADNLLVLLLGWEGVGLCSYLLIGFWYREPANGRAARKAFVVTRVGDAGLAVALFLIFDRLGTLQIPEVAARATQLWAPGSGVAVAAASLLLVGALGKSAQLPLQTWLPDAMAGPTPVSALIHAATMVTAGAYLIARLNALFVLAPPVQHAVAVIGALTLLTAGCSALAQSDLKRALAYSTMSQIGYLFVALGVGAWGAAVFHLVTHAFFKALLFLCAGAVIAASGGRHDLAAMGGLRRKMPLIFWTFLAGAASLAALPFVTAGFYSKDLILLAAWSSPWGGGWLWAAGIGGAALTALYAFRLVFLVFFGAERPGAVPGPGPAISAPLVALAVLAIGGGLLGLPAVGGSLLATYRAPADPAAAVAPVLRSAAVLAVLSGVWFAYLLYHPGHVRPGRAPARAARAAVKRLAAAGWGFDFLYDRMLVRPFLRVAVAGREDPADLPFSGLAWYALHGHRLLIRAQSGKLRWYAAGVAIGAIVALGIAVLQ
jgi:NADH-quinone oxidoreductase subunit L